MGLQQHHVDAGALRWARCAWHAMLNVVLGVLCSLASLSMMPHIPWRISVAEVPGALPLRLSCLRLCSTF